MIKTFSTETGVDVQEMYWIGNIGHHAKSLSTQMIGYLKQAFSQAIPLLENQHGKALPYDYDAIDIEMMKDLWGQTAWFNTFYQGVQHDSLPSHIDALAKLPGLNEILQSPAMDLEDVAISLNAGDWKDSLSIVNNEAELTNGSLLVCLQAPHGCMIKAGDSEMKVRRGDIIMLNERIKHTVLPTNPIYMPKSDNETSAEWIDKHGIVFMQLNRVKKAA